ncbi:hypothetical protein V6N12_057676 [Hibiscus sabdariffa]|uniref:Uncharacterized protein n=1 Tax=Hibiscus sabdariffa TaxID=183260 RepID=A0ABR2C5V3_9ROSI
MSITHYCFVGGGRWCRRRLKKSQRKVFFFIPGRLASVDKDIFLASSDTSILDSDIPLVLVFVAAGATEVKATTGIMEFITRYVLSIAVFMVK